jgi:hypothetical protein
MRRVKFVMSFGEFGSRTTSESLSVTLPERKNPAGKLLKPSNSIPLISPDKPFSNVSRKSSSVPGRRTRSIGARMSLANTDTVKLSPLP